MRLVEMKLMCPFTAVLKIKRGLARQKVRREELGLAAVDHAMEMVLKMVRHVVVRRQD
jgi:hypothetical protein